MRLCAACSNGIDAARLKRWPRARSCSSFCAHDIVNDGYADWLSAQNGNKWGDYPGMSRPDSADAFVTSIPPPTND